MKALLPCLALAALGHAVYHMGQKTMPASVNPMALLMGGYAVAFVLATLAMPFFRAPGDAPWTAPAFNLPVLVLGVGAVLIELGFLLIYRRGGVLQWTAAAVSGLSALVLVPVGIAFFREGLSLGRLLGIAMTLAGLVLVGRK